MKRPTFGYVLLLVFVLSIVYAAMLRKDSLTTAEVMPFAIGLICVAVLWYWMLFNLIANRKKMEHPIRWGIFLILANWLAAIVYFFVKYTPTENKSYFRNIREWITCGEGYRLFYAKIATISLVVVIFHHVFMDVLYKTVNLYEYQIYRDIIGVIYFPLKSFLTWICSMLTIDTEHPTQNLIIFARVMRFIYTYLIFFVITTLLLISDKRKHQRTAS